jgi:nucleoside-diphosphate-sugar epimerase
VEVWGADRDVVCPRIHILVDGFIVCSFVRCREKTVTSNFEFCVIFCLGKYIVIFHKCKQSTLEDIMKVLVTGSTGAIGVPLVNSLLSKGHEVVILTRTRPSRSLKEVRKLFSGKVEIIEGDVTLDSCGVVLRNVIARKGTIDLVIHSAGKTQYHERLREDTYIANSEGTRNALTLAVDMDIERFVFISTAYVAGRKVYLGESDLGSLQNVHNPYEESKILAEAHVRDFPGEHLILRLSTVIGDRKTGRIINAGGYAGFVKGFWAKRKRIVEYPNNPFWVGVNPASTLNLITNDWVVDHICRAASSRLEGTVHLTHPVPVGMSWLFHETFVNGLQLPLTYDLNESEKRALFDDRKWKSTQDFIAGIADYFGPYITRDTVFEHQRAKFIPGYQAPEIIDEHVIRAQMDYMTNFLFEKKKLEVAAA